MTPSPPDPAAAAPPPSATELQARIAHLTMIQGVIGRVAGYSATVKNFALTLGAALVAVAFNKSIPGLLAPAIGVTIIFMVLDAYYLALERCFRDLYGEVASRSYDLAFDLQIKHRGAQTIHIIRAVGSTSVSWFYVPLLVVIGTLLLISEHVHAAPS